MINQRFRGIVDSSPTVSATFLGLIVAIALAGCASMWVEPTNDRATYEHDLTFCHSQAQVAAMMMTTTPTTRRSWFSARLRDCMRARGWLVKDEPR